MADYSCDYCTYSNKCFRAYNESECPYSICSEYGVEYIDVLKNKINNILSALDELKELDNKQMFDDDIYYIKNKIKFELYNKLLLKDEWENMTK